MKWKDETPPPEARLHIPSPTDVERLIVATPAPWALLVELAAYSGLRAGELAGLQVRHVDTTARTVRVEQTVADLDGVLTIGKPKSHAGYRTVGDLDADLCKRHATHLFGKRTNDFVFEGRDDEGKPPRTRITTSTPASSSPRPAGLRLRGFRALAENR